MLLDYNAGRRGEVDAINGSIPRLGKQRRRAHSGQRDRGRDHQSARRPASQREPLSRHVSNRGTEKEKTLNRHRDTQKHVNGSMLDSVEAFEGIGRVDELLDGIVKLRGARARKSPFAANTAYVNTIAPHDEPAHDRAIEHKIRSLLIPWNAAAIVLRANKTSSATRRAYRQLPIGATLYDTGFMHFWHAPTDLHGGDLVYYQVIRVRPASTRAHTSKGA